MQYDGFCRVLSLIVVVWVINLTGFSPFAGIRRGQCRRSSKRNTGAAGRTRNLVKM